jgi:hypothetical protein
MRDRWGLHNACYALPAGAIGGYPLTVNIVVWLPPGPNEVKLANFSCLHAVCIRVKTQVRDLQSAIVGLDIRSLDLERAFTSTRVAHMHPE